MTKKDQENLAVLYTESKYAYGYDEETDDYDSAQSLKDNVENLIESIEKKDFKDALNILPFIQNDLSRELYNQVNRHK